MVPTLIHADGVIVDDLRAVLLEVASVPPLIRQNQELYQKRRLIGSGPSWSPWTRGYRTRAPL